MSVSAIETFLESQKFVAKGDSLKLQVQLLGAMNAISRRYGFANCWHLSNCESDAFWRIYGGEAIAPQSSIGHLKASFHADDSHEVNIGAGTYVQNPEGDIVASQTKNAVILTKRTVFEYEREVRAFSFVIPPLPSYETGELWEAAVKHAEVILAENVPPGQKFDVDLQTLVQRVYIAPSQPSWFKEMLETMMIQSGFGSPMVIQSSVGERPEYWRYSDDLIRNQELHQKNLVRLMERFGGPDKS